MAQLQGLFDLILQLCSFLLSHTHTKESPKYPRYSYFDIKGACIDKNTNNFRLIKLVNSFDLSWYKTHILEHYEKCSKYCLVDCRASM